MGKQYQHLSVEERAVIQVERENGSSYRSIAQRLGRNVLSIVREVKRNESACERDLNLCERREAAYNSQGRGVGIRILRLFHLSGVPIVYVDSEVRTCASPD